MSAMQNVTMSSLPARSRPAPHLRWISTPMGHFSTWIWLAVDGVAAPFWISKERAGRETRALGGPYRVLGSGMDPSSGAGSFGCVRTLKDAKARVLELCCLAALPAEELTLAGRRWCVGDRVRFHAEHWRGPRRGRIASLTTGTLGTVLWDGEDEAAPMHIPWLAVLS